MFFRKQLVASDHPWKQKQKNYKTKEISVISPQMRCAVLLVSLSAWFLALTCFFRLQPKYPTNNTKSLAATCDGNSLVYVYDLPAKFNIGMLKHCNHLNIYTNMCPHVANCGLGQPLPSHGFSNSSSFASTIAWYATHQFLAEMIFHARVENHPCRTRDPSQATLFYVPFYGGLHASSNFREGNHTARDELALQLAAHLEGQPWFQLNHGGDHFLALGRTAWDFMRVHNGPDFGANSLLNLPLVKNMSVLTVERNPWHGSNQHGIPYPSYLHPTTSSQMLAWQRQVDGFHRPHLFSFIGGPRKGVEKATVRDELIRQCSESTRCLLMKCTADGRSKCHEPSEVLRVMAESVFCLQAPGDSFTRRSTFDSVVAGCIPVFFSPHTAYSQYEWYLPEDVDEYSVNMEGIEKENGSRKIEDELLKISSDRVERMRSKIIYQLLPKITYAHPNASDVGFQDAVDVGLAALAKHVRFKLGLGSAL